MRRAAVSDRDHGDETKPRRPSSEEITRSHVELMLSDLGFNPAQVAALADAGVDWHEASRLIGSGCDHLTAVDILT